MASASEPNAAALGEPRPLRSADLDRACSAIARAFAWHEPWGEWALPDAGTRERTMLRLVRDDVEERFLPSGECWTIGGACVTLWIPPPTRPGAEVFARRRGEAEYAAFGPLGEAMRAGDDLISALKPAGEHWYLDTIATEPELHGQGLGGRLLDHDLEVRDAAGDACALDTHTAENIGFYERRGFEVIGEGVLPAGGPALYVMYRPAR